MKPESDSSSGGMCRVILQYKSTTVPTVQPFLVYRSGGGCTHNRSEGGGGDTIMLQRFLFFAPIFLPLSKKKTRGRKKPKRD